MLGKLGFPLLVAGAALLWALREKIESDAKYVATVQGLCTCPQCVAQRRNVG